MFFPALLTFPDLAPVHRGAVEQSDSGHAERQSKSTVERDLGIVLNRALNDWKAVPNRKTDGTGYWMSRSSRDRTVFKSKPPDEKKCLAFDAYSYLLGGTRMVIACTEDVCAWRMVDSAWRTIILPERVIPASEWMKSPKLLSNGCILFTEDSLFAEGNRVPQRLEMVRIRGHRATVFGPLQGQTTLDVEPPRVNGNQVTVDWLDDPKTFGVYPTQLIFERYETWDCTPNGFRLVLSKPDQLALRSLDATIYRAWTSRRPSPLQRRVRRLWPRPKNDEEGLDEMLDYWKQTIQPNGLIRIDFDNTSFLLRPGRSGYRLVSVCRRPPVGARSASRGL